MYRKTKRGGLPSFLKSKIKKARQKAIAHGLEPTILSTSEHTNMPVAPSAGKRTKRKSSIWKWCKAKLNIS
jgi:hypothetical protein